MVGVVSQSLPLGQPVAGFAQRDASPGNLGLVNYGLQSASFTAKKNGTYVVPTGGTITLPTPTGSLAYLAITPFGATTSTLSGTLSVGSSILSSLIIPGGQTLILCDADATRGWC